MRRGYGYLFCCSLGCGIGYGYLHRIPNRSESVGPSKPFPGSEMSLPGKTPSPGGFTEVAVFMVFIIHYHKLHHKGLVLNLLYTVNLFLYFINII